MHPALLLEQLKMKALLEQLPAWVSDAFTNLYKETYHTAYKAGQSDERWDQAEKDDDEA